MIKIGIIGTGMLGEAVGQHLLNSNYDVVVFNRTKNKTEKLVQVGATLVKSPREVGFIFFRNSRMPADSNWNTPVVMPLAKSSYTFGSSNDKIRL